MKYHLIDEFKKCKTKTRFSITCNSVILALSGFPMLAYKPMKPESMYMTYLPFYLKLLKAAYFVYKHLANII